MFNFVCVSLLLLTLVPVCRSGTDAQMRSLFNDLINNANYSSRVRPIRDTGNTLSVTVDMFFIGINEVDEVEQKVKSTGYLKIYWSDTFMTWTTTNYGGIDKLLVPQGNIWKPDLALANAYDTVSGLGDNFMYLEINSTGYIFWQPYQVFDSTCSLDMTYFPFDTQTCEIQLVTWSSTKQMINLQFGSAGFNIDSYEKNANWDLVSVNPYDSSTTTTAGLSFSFRMKRKPMFYLITFIVPVILLAMLNVCVFILPADSGEKTGYAIILFLTFAIYLLIVTDTMPEGMSTVPIISIYLLLECIISTLIIFITIAQLRLHNQCEETEVPGFYQFIVTTTTTLQRKIGIGGKKKAIKKNKRKTKKKPKEEETKDVGKTKDDDSGSQTRSKPIRAVTSKVTPTPSDEGLTDASVHTQSETYKQSGSSGSSPKQSGGSSSSSSSGIHSGEETPDAVPEETRSGLVRQKTELTKGGPPVGNIPSFPKTKDLDDYRKTPVLLTDLEASNMAYDTTRNGAPPLDTETSFVSSNRRRPKSSLFKAVKQMPLDIKEVEEDSSSEEENDEKDKEISWSDVTTALDVLFFCTFTVINIVLTIVAYSVAAAGGSSQ